MKIDEKLLDEATEWFARMQRKDAKAEFYADFQVWLKQDVAHQVAYAQIDELWDSLSCLDGVAIEELKPTKSTVLFSSWKRWFNYPLFAAAAAIVLSVMVFLIYPDQTASSMRIYTTQIGEHKDLLLDDGTHIYMNTNSQIKVSLQDERRLVYLDYGEVFFDVASDPNRPFVTAIPEGVVRVLGTQFNILAWDKKSVVTVVEGLVGVVFSKNEELITDTLKRVENIDIQLKPDQQILLSQNVKDTVPMKIDAQSIQAWRNHKLIYNGENFKQVLSDINRYFKGTIKIGDPKLNDLQVVAVLDVQDKDALILALEETFNIKAIKTADNTVILYPRF